MREPLERACRQCDMLESDAQGFFCSDDDGRMANHNWNEPRDELIEHLRAVLTRIAEMSKWTDGEQAIELARQEMGHDP